MDLNVSAFRIVQQITEENKEDNHSEAKRVAGRIGGPARAKKLTAERRKAIALKANKARWATRKTEIG